MENPIGILQNVDVNESLTTGRNGVWPIKGIHIWSGGGKVYLDGISKTGKTLNAGFIIDRKSFDELVRQLAEMEAVSC